MNLSRCHANFKLHKPHLEYTEPTLRPIVCGSGSITENLGIYVDHQIKEIATYHESYIQDTPDFLRKLDKINHGQNFQVMQCL